MMGLQPLKPKHRLRDKTLYGRLAGRVVRVLLNRGLVVEGRLVDHAPYEILVETDQSRLIIVNKGAIALIEEVG